jgi:hypothetical protein
MSAELVKVDDRAVFVRSRLLEINAQANNLILENGLLLREYKQNGYFREDGYKSFDDAIQMMQNAGKLDYGPRQARYFISIVDMVDTLQISPGEIDQIGVSKLREIAGVPAESDKRKLLDSAKDMSVGEVQKEAKRLRDIALGRESDPLVPIVLKTTQSQCDMFNDCIQSARSIYSLPEEMSETSILIDIILTAWFNVKDNLVAEQVEQMTQV